MKLILIFFSIYLWYTIYKEKQNLESLVTFKNTCLGGANRKIKK